jgi:hypothetical protein
MMPRNKHPEKKQIHNALSSLAEIKFMRSKTAEEKRKQRGDCPAFAFLNIWRGALSDAAFRADFSFQFYNAAALAAKFFVNPFC